MRYVFVQMPRPSRVTVICAVSVFWIAAVLWSDEGAGIWQQRLLGLSLAEHQ